MCELSDLEFLLSMSPSNEWLRDSPDGLDSLFDDLDQDFSYDNPYNPAGPKNKEPPTANQPQLESSSDLQTNAIPVPVLDRTSTPSDASGTSSNLNFPPIATVAQPIHELSVQTAPASLKRRRQSEETKVEGRPEKKKRGEHPLKTGSTEGGSSAPSKERSAKRRAKHSAYYAGLDLLLNQASTISAAGSYAIASGSSLGSDANQT